MSLSPEVAAIVTDPFVRRAVRIAKNDAAPFWRNEELPSGDVAEIRREGHYPSVTNEGAFSISLLRMAPFADQSFFIGSEFRVFDNLKYGKDESDALIIMDDTPLFLKELSDSKFQKNIAEARMKLTIEERQGYLVQRRVPSAIDGELRNRLDGQMDIVEEQWYAKMLRIMKLYPGMKSQQAAEVLVKLHEKAYLSDTGTGIQSVLSWYYDGDFPEWAEVEILRGNDLLDSFGDEVKTFDLDELVAIDHNKMCQELQLVSPADLTHIEADNRQFTAQTLASYPIMQGGAEFTVKLIQVKEKNEITFRTFRVLQHGDPAQARLRLDSICENGVQGGDNHCDCVHQTENEKRSAIEGNSIILVNIRDDEGRGHGEAQKGATLAAQRMIEQRYPIGNAKAAQLIYEGSKMPVDIRDFTSSTVVLKFLGITSIAHFVTDNEDKIKAVKAACTINNVVTAEVKGLSQEALRTKEEKAMGYTGVPYRYEK